MNVRDTALGWLDSIPLVTKSVVVLCIGVYLLQVFVGISLGFVCNYPAIIIAEPLQEFWRLFISNFFHAGLLHLVLNMMSFRAIGGSLESNLGSFLMLYIMILFNVATSALHLILSAILSRAFGQYSYEHECSVGLSGVIFAVLTIRCNQSGQQSQSLFGFIVPSKFYPWVLLVVIQLVMPNVSFLGHLAGILVGMAYSWGIFSFIFPSASKLASMESSDSLHWLVTMRGFVLHSEPGLPGIQQSHSGGWISSLFSSNVNTVIPPSQHYLKPSHGHVLGSTMKTSEGTPAESAAAAAMMRLHLMTTNSAPTRSVPTNSLSTVQAPPPTPNNETTAPATSSQTQS